MGNTPVGEKPGHDGTSALKRPGLYASDPEVVLCIYLRQIHIWCVLIFLFEINTHLVCIDLKIATVPRSPSGPLSLPPLPRNEVPRGLRMIHAGLIT